MTMMTMMTTSTAVASPPAAAADDPTSNSVVAVVPVDTLIVDAGLSGAVAFHDIVMSASTGKEATTVNTTTNNNNNNHQGDVLLVEARPDRCGGRTCTESIGISKRTKGTTNDTMDADDSSSLSLSLYDVDTGGQWLGACQSHIMAIVQDLQLTLEPQSFPAAAVTVTDPSGGSSKAAEQLIEMAYYRLKELSPEAQREIDALEMYLQECHERLVRLLRHDKDKQNPNNNTNNGHLQPPEQQEEELQLVKEWDRCSIGHVIDTQCTIPDAREQWRYLVQTVLAVDATECSFLFFLYYVDVWGGGMDLLGDGPEGLQAFKVKGGTQQITQRLIDKAITSAFPMTARVEYGCEIVHIDYSGVVALDQGDVQAATDGNTDGTTTGMIRATAANGTIYECRNVVLALSPTLFAQCISFDPPLEQERMQLYNNMIMGSAVKVIIVFEEAFWRTANQNDCSDKSDGNARGVGGKSISQVGLVSNIFETTVGEHPALIGLITGCHAIEFHAFIQDDNVDHEEIILKQIYDMYWTNNINHNDDQAPLPPPPPKPLAFIVKDWIAERYSGGCFAPVVAPSDDAVFFTHGHLLRQPIVPHRLVLAGTESATAFYGYLEGAVRAGARAAEEVLLSGQGMR